MAKAQKSGGFSAKLFLLLAALALLGLWLLKQRPSAPVEPPPGNARACLQALEQDLKSMGVTPALCKGGQLRLQVGGTLQFRFPRHVLLGNARGKVEQAAVMQGCRLEGGAAEAPKGLARQQWRILMGKTHVATLIAETSSRPALAVLLDDWGYNTRGLAVLDSLPSAVSVAIFPWELKSSALAKHCAAKGREVLVHLPMEPSKPMPLVEGTLQSSMSDEALYAMALKNLSAFPEAAGVNNHEGSKGTADARVMRQVLRVCQEKKLFFLDSLTASNSVAKATAQQMSVRTAARQVFLDNEDYEDLIEESLRKAAHWAKSKGSCIAIGHPHANTLKVLARLSAEIESQGVEMVPVSELVR
jgi:polysaccharide deacetylase 2 family uncharacterized protein YibQ